MKNLNLDVISPDQVGAILRAAAQSYREGQSELQSAWQDDSAGLVWGKLADTLEQAAGKADKACDKYFK